MWDVRLMAIGCGCGLMAAPGRSQIGVSRGCCRWVPKKKFWGGQKKFRLWLRDLAAGWVWLYTPSQLRGCLLLICWAALAGAVKGTAWAGFYCVILLPRQ